MLILEVKPAEGRCEVVTRAYGKPDLLRKLIDSLLLAYGNVAQVDSDGTPSFSLAYGSLSILKHPGTFRRVPDDTWSDFLFDLVSAGVLFAVKFVGDVPIAVFPVNRELVAAEINLNKALAVVKRQQESPGCQPFALLPQRHLYWASAIVPNFGSGRTWVRHLIRESPQDVQDVLSDFPIQFDRAIDTLFWASGEKPSLDPDATTVFYRE